ncbi:MAG: fructose-bisphosphatase class III, partial [Candidatus Omnitrophica bacterium]|nr:fructose-bisphosphatase class III [Candidatus Omnitrophota bacterium]
LFELQDLLEKNQAKLIFGEKEFWTIGGCLGNPFLTALSIASELRYNNFDMLNKLGIDFNVLMDFADAEPKYTSENIADLKKRLPGGMNSIYEQAMFNIRLKLDPLRSPREKALLLARIPEEYLILKTGNFNVRERALMAKVRGDLTISAGDLSPEEQDVLLSMFRREYGLSEREQAVLNSLRMNFVASPQARSLVLSFLEHFKLFDVIEPSPLMRKIDETTSGFPGITWNKHPTAIVLHGNVAVDRQGRFVDIDGKALPGGVTVREYYRQLEQNIRDFAGEVKNLYRRLDAGEISAKEFLETIDSRPTMRLIEKLSLSPYSPLFVRYEKGAEYLYLHDVAEPDGYAYALQASDESGAFMDRVFDQFGAARDSAVLVIGHKSMVDGHVKTLANNRVLMVDPYFAKKRGAVGEDLDTGKGAGVVVGGSGVVTVALDPDRKGVGAATIDTEVVARRNLILSELPPDVPETYEGWKEMVSNARKNNVLFKNPLLQAINNLNARLKSVLSLPEPAYCIEQAI